MKKTLAILLASVLVLAVTAACAELTEPVTLSFAAQEVGTGAYNYAAALQTVMLEELPDGSTINITTDSPGGVGAPVLIDNEATDLILSNAGPAKWTKEGGIESIGIPQAENVSALVGDLGHDFINIMFTQKFVDETGITTIEELVEQKYPVKLVIKKNGTLGELSAEKVLEALGVSLDDITEWGGVVEKTGGDAIKSGLQDDLYDMTIDHIAAGQSNTTELCLTHDMYDVQMGDELLEALVENGYDYVTVEPNTWNGQTEEIQTVGSQQVILVSPSMDEDLAYTLTKAVIEHRDELANAVAALSYLDPEIAGTLTMTGVELHPGAAKYYEEKGYAYN